MYIYIWNALSAKRTSAGGRVVDASYAIVVLH